MTITVKQTRAIQALAGRLSDFLPGSGAKQWTNHVNFGTVAERVGVGDFWDNAGSKGPRIARLLERTLDSRPHYFERLILAIIKEGLHYRDKNNKPVTPDEIHCINGHLHELNFQFPELWDSSLHDAIAVNDTERAHRNVADAARQREVATTKRQRDRHELGKLMVDLSEIQVMSNRQKAGYRLEGFLNRLFTLENLAPRKPFKVEGEQIDGSFVLSDEVYLLEAKWEQDALSHAPLSVFRTVIEGKSNATRGVFIAMNGVTKEAEQAIRIGKQPNFFIMNGHDLMMILQAVMELPEFLRRRQRLLAEEAAMVVPFKDLT